MRIFYVLESVTVQLLTQRTRACPAGDAWVAVGSAQDLLGVTERMSAVQVS